MNIPLDALVTAGVGIFGSAAGYAGTRFMSRRADATENRKVDLQQFETFKAAYYEQLGELKAREAERDAQMNKIERLLRQALRHILDLRTDMREQGVHPSHTAPPELESLLWSFGSGDAPAPVSSEPSGD